LRFAADRVEVALVPSPSAPSWAAISEAGLVTATGSAARRPLPRLRAVAAAWRRSRCSTPDGHGSARPVRQAAGTPEGHRPLNR
jgi:hypothetical protein